MPDSTLLTQLRQRYIDLSKEFFILLEQGKTVEELQSHQEEIEKTLLEIDKLEQNSTGNE